MYTSVKKTFKELFKWIIQRMHTHTHTYTQDSHAFYCRRNATKDEITWINNKSMHFCVTDYVRLTSFNHFAVILILKSYDLCVYARAFGVCLFDGDKNTQPSSFFVCVWFSHEWQLLLYVQPFLVYLKFQRKILIFAVARKHHQRKMWKVNR